jgi:hypothetical protein
VKEKFYEKSPYRLEEVKQNIHRALEESLLEPFTDLLKHEQKLKALMPDCSGHFQHSIKY